MSQDIITVGDLVEKLEEFDKELPVILKIVTSGYDSACVSYNSLWISREHSDDITIQICGERNDYR